MSKSTHKLTPLSWLDELTIYTLLPLHCAFHAACMWSNSKYKDIDEILYRPSIYQGVGQRMFGEGAICNCFKKRLHMHTAICVMSIVGCLENQF